MSVKSSPSSFIRSISSRLNPLPILAAMESEKRRPVIASTSLFFFLATQWYLPQLLFIGEVNAQGRIGNPPIIGNPPVQIQSVQPQQPTVTTKRGALKKSETSDCEDCKVTVRALDLKKVPTERELRQAGQFGGALSPIGNADVAKMEAEMNKRMTAMGISPAVAATAPEKTLPGQLGKIKRDKVKRLKDINLSFGKAMQEWNKHNYRPAAKLLEKHVEEFPDSPWAGEALLHLGCDSKYNGRFAEAQARYDQLLQATSDDPKDPSFEIHQKAKLRWADLDISTGKLTEAQAKLRDILATDKDWRRQTWAITWLRRTTQYKKNARDLRACGSQALGYMLASLNYNEASRVVSQMAPPRDSGFNLAELRQISARYGVPLEGFRAQPEQLASLPTPLLLHYDFDKATPKLVTPKIDRLSLATGEAMTQIRREDSKKKTPAEKNLYSLRGRAGHYVVASRIDAKKRTVALYDPQGGRHYTLSFDQLKREWSGAGLVRANKKVIAGSAKASPARVAKLGSGEMKETVGGCCGAPRPGGGPGEQPGDNSPNDKDCNDTKGSPHLTINTVSFNSRVEDTPLWYSTPVGPDVSFTMNYNSLDSINQNTAVGNKWVFNYGSYVIEDTGAGGGVVTVFMPDGAQDNFYPDSSGQYHPSKGKFERLVKRSATRYELISPKGDRMIYDIPAGTDSLQSMLVEVRDRWGYSLHMGYSAGFTVQLTSVTDAQGKVTGLVYDDEGHVIKVRDPFSREVKFDYEDGNLVRAIDMEGNVFHYAYNSRIELTQINSAQGITKIDTDYPYQGQTNSQTNITVTNPKGEKVRYIWDGIYEGPEFSRFINKRGAETRYYIGEVIDGVPKITRIQNALGQTTVITHELTHGLPASVTDARGAMSSVQYNEKGQVVRTVDAKRRVSQLFYDPSNGIDLIAIKDTRGRTIGTFTYDEKHQPLSATDWQNRTTSLSYTVWGAAETKTNAQGHVATVIYDATTKRPISSTLDGISQGSVTYDAIGRVKTSTDMTGLTVSLSYNDLDKPAKVDYPDGTFSSIEYSCCSLPGVLRDRAGRKTYFDYDELNRVVRVQEPGGQTLEFDYDAEGNLTRLTDAEGAKTSFSYDILNRYVGKKYPDGTTESVSYDIANNAVVRQDAKGRITRSFYDIGGNLTYLDYPTMPDVRLKYNDLDQVVEMQDAVGTTRYTYDSEDRVKTIDGPWSDDLQNYDYNETGYLTGTQIGIGNGISQQSSYSYDALERLSGLTTNAGTFTLTYTGETSMVNQVSYPNGTQTDYGYDFWHRLVGQELKKTEGTTSTSLARYAFTFEGGSYENRGLRTGMERQFAGEPLERISWAFDASNQLVGEQTTQVGSALHPTVAPAKTLTFALDAMGNRMSQSLSQGDSATNISWSSNALNQFTNAASSRTQGVATQSWSQSLAYDALGNRTAQSISGEGLQNAVNLSYIYDEANRLSQIVRRDATNDAPLHKSEFVYDGQSRRRVVREFTWNTAVSVWQSVSDTRFVYEGMDVVQERDGQNAVTVNLTRLGNIGGILARSSQTALGQVQHRYLHSDGNGNVDGVSSEDGELLAWASYDAFGTRTVGGQSGELGAYGFQSKWTHPSTGLVDFGLRFYDVSQGRFINRDPLREMGGTHLYNFAAHNPANFSDAYGLCLQPWQILGLMAVGGLMLVGGAPAWAIIATGAAVGYGLGQLNEYAGICKADPFNDALGGLGATATGAVMAPELMAVGGLATAQARGWFSGGLARSSGSGDIKLIPGGTGRAFAGHGIEEDFAGNGFPPGPVTVPEGTRIMIPGKRGVLLPDGLGRAIESADTDAILANEKWMQRMEGAATYLPGSEVPNLMLTPGNGLTMMQKSMRVNKDVTLDQLLKPNMGQVDWAACRECL